ncbi:MAG: PfkB family carbohydrate kinase [Pseudomonadota bacterium]
MILTIGEILFDQFPDYRRIGGAPFNFSFHLQQFGRPVRFVSRVGRDEAGREILSFLAGRGFPVKDIQTDPARPTGLVRVTLSGDGIPSFEIVREAAYDHISYEDIVDLPRQSEVEMIYFGSVIQRTDSAYEALHRFLAGKYPRAKTFFDINLRQGCINTKAILSSLEKTDILKLNEEELGYLMDIKGAAGRPDDFVRVLMNEYDVEMVALTRGDRGSVVFTSQERLSLASGRVGVLADTVGAGDAYASITALGYIEGWPLGDMMEKASAFAARICELEGTVPDYRDFYLKAASELGIRPPAASALGRDEGAI